MSLFDKLKVKSDQVEDINEEEADDRPAAKPAPIKDSFISDTKKTLTVAEKEESAGAVDIDDEEAKKKKWFEPEGQLAVDFYQTSRDFVIQTAIAGIDSKDLDILIEKDMVTIRGRREKPQESSDIKYFYQECYWGPFSREIILPQEVDTGHSEADMKDGILTIRMAKIDKEKKKISIKAD